MTNGILTRPRLLELLDRRDPSITLVTAPSGFGKTTLARSWVDAERATTGHGSTVPEVIVWVALNSEAASSRAFWQTVAICVARSGQLDPAASRTLVGDVDAHEDPVAAMASFLDQHGPVVLVLDAYEHIRDATSAIDDDILRLTERVRSLRVVVTTRGTTRLRDEVLELRGRVRTITERDLQFRTEEIDQLLHDYAPDAIAAAERLQRDTRGYPLAVRAAILKLGRRSSAAEPGDDGWQALVTADLKSQLADPEVVDFVLDTCIPPYFDVHLARSLTGIDDVDAMLAELEWNGFGRWVPYAPQRPVFQYVESVRDVFLNDLVNGQVRRYRTGAATAAAWLHRNDYHEEALGLAIDAKHFDLASSITRTLIVTTSDSYTTDRFARHLGRVPRSVMPQYPMLAFGLGLAFNTNRATRPSAGECFHIVASIRVSDAPQATQWEVFYNHAIKSASLRFLGQFRASGDVASVALDHFDALSVDQREVDGDFQPIALRNLAYSLFEVGDVDRAHAVIGRAVVSAHLPWSRNYTLSFGIGIYAIDGRGSEASTTLAMEDPEAWPRDHERSHTNAFGLVGRALLDLDAFDCDAALRRFDGCESFIDTSETWPFITWALMHARLGLGEAETEAHRVEEALASTPPRLGVGANLSTAMVRNALAILWLAAGRGDRARAIAEAPLYCEGQLAPARLLRLIVAGDADEALRRVPQLEAHQGHTIRSRAALLTLGAVAALRTDNEAAATSLLMRAAALFQAHGVRAHLLYVPAPDLAALRALADRVANPTCVAYLAHPVDSPIGGGDAAAVRLTARERAVLLAFTEHRTRAEVAAALYVSSNTIKTQLSSVYRKLGVSSRDHAIQRAIELDLLEP